MTRDAAVVKLSTSSGADQASAGGKAAVSMAKARIRPSMSSAAVRSWAAWKYA
jgi:hypothetical protein